MRRLAGLALLAILVAGCGAAVAGAAGAPTPRIVFVTAPPAAQPTPMVVFVTPPPGTTHLVRGTLLVHSDRAVYRASCVGHEPYADLHDGTAVVVRDGHDAIVAAGMLAQGAGEQADVVFHGRTTPRSASNADRAPDGPATFHDCRMPFSVEVPDADAYAFEFADAARYIVPSRDLAAHDWSMDFTLGE
jgi:hypothetical protein